ncbi:MAG: oligosaccharide flippase family protein [Solirubrobacteraceae bacterium]|nr:oligosaccharide flippase family protein [Solirubrobacteraceae bacterium]
MATMLGVAATLVALLITGSLAARILGPTDRGYFALLVLVPSLVCQVGGLGISLALTHYVAAGEIGASQGLRLLRRVLALQVAAVTVASVVVGIALNLGHPGYVMGAVLIAASFAVTTYLKEYTVGLVQASGRSVSANLLKAFSPVAGAVGLTALYVGGAESLTAVVVVWAATEWISSALLVVVTRMYLRRDAPGGDVDSAVSRARILEFGRAAYFSYLSPLDTFRLDQLYVGVALSATALGYYAAGAAFTTIPRVLAHSVGLTAAPLIARQRFGARVSVRRTGLVLGGLAIGTSAVTALAVGLSAEWLVPALYGDAFRPAIALTQILMVGGFLFAVRRILIDVLRGVGRPAAGWRSEVGGLVVFAVLAPVLSAADAEAGVAWAFTIAAAVNVGSLLWRERRLVRLLRSP